MFHVFTELCPKAQILLSLLKDQAAGYKTQAKDYFSH